MNRKKSLIAGLLAFLLLAMLGFVLYRFRSEIAVKTGEIVGRFRNRCRCGKEYHDYADV